MTPIGPAQIKRLSKAVRHGFRPKRAVCLEGAVYFARCGDHVKIGYAADVQARLAILQAGNPRPLVLIGWMRGTPQSERNLHERFGKLWVRGEWFRAAPSLLRFIESVTPDRSPDGATFRSPPARVDGPEHWS